ncbi:hypothetical protein D3C75_649810 [compost metagenome]
MDPFVGDILVDGVACRFLENMAQMILGEKELLRQNIQAKRLVQVGIDVFQQLADFGHGGFMGLGVQQLIFLDAVDGGQQLHDDAFGHKFLLGTGFGEQLLELPVILQNPFFPNQLPLDQIAVPQLPVFNGPEKIHPVG